MHCNNENDLLLALADMVNQFAYNTKFRGRDAICDGGLSALERAFIVLEENGCKMNSNGTIQRKNLWKFMERQNAGFGSTGR